MWMNAENTKKKTSFKKCHETLFKKKNAEQLS